MSGSGLVSLTDLVGRPVRATDGRVLGRLHDLSVRLGASPPVVDRVLVRPGGSRTPVPWPGRLDVAARGVDDGLTIDVDVEPAAADADLRLRPDELLLVRDILDCQIVDIAGRRVTRASDVVLATTAGAGLVLVGVEVGAAALLRRLGLAWLAPRRSHQIVAMDQLHLTSSRGHQVQLTAATSAMHRLDSTGLAHLLTRLDVTKATEVITAVGPDRAASALLKAHPEVGGRLMRALPVSESARIRARLGRDSTRTHPHLHAPDLARPRRSRRLAGWRTHHPPRAAA